MQNFFLISLVPFYTTQAQYILDQIQRGLVICLLCQVMNLGVPTWLHVGTKMQLNTIAHPTISVTIRLILK